MFRQNDFFGKLQHRFTRTKIQNVISDVYDGALYEKHFRNGFLSNPNNISFSWYTDGVPVFKSSGTSKWPIYLVINELPYEERMKEENMILVTIWHGPEKPEFSIFLWTLCVPLEKLKSGFKCKISDGETIKVKRILLFGTADLPATSDSLNFSHHNAEHGCPNCITSSETVYLSANSHTYGYPYKEDIALRTAEQSKEYATQAMARLQKVVMGVKGPTSLSSLLPDFITGTAIDKMHCIDNGVVKKLLIFISIFT